MGRDDENYNQNLSGDNLKSLLKKPGTKGKSNNRVVFNENKNEFFDADYIILIREECEYDDDDESEICTCNEMVSAVCGEPNCGCNMYDSHEQTPPSPKFAPPMEFVDVVTLSPPEGYKDMELDEQQLITLTSNSSKPAVCRECIASQKEIEKVTDFQAFTPLEETPFDKEETDFGESRNENVLQLTASPISGILKGGLYWKNQETALMNDAENKNQIRKLKTENEDANQRAVRFFENGEAILQDNGRNDEDRNCLEFIKKDTDTNQLTSQEATEMMLTFKLGNHVLVSNNSLKPNSAVRQLFPYTKTDFPEHESSEQYLVSPNRLHSFGETKVVSKLPQIVQSCEKRTIEHSTLRRSFIRYEPKIKKNIKKDDNSLVERIKLLTCDLDDNNENIEETGRISPTGEESHENYETDHKDYIKNASPSSTSSTSSNSSSISSTYKKITDLFGKKEKGVDMNVNTDITHSSCIPDIGGPQNQNINHCHTTLVNTVVENKKLLTTLVPLTACVNNMGESNDYYYNMNNDYTNQTVSCSTNTDCIAESTNGKIHFQKESKLVTPDVIAGTPSTVEPVEQLSVLVQQDVNRTERIKKNCRSENEQKKEDDEHDDYGFNKRPSVQCVKPRVGATTEILHQIQNHLEGPIGPIAKLTWPYYSESSFTENNQNTTKIVPDGRVFSPRYQSVLLKQDSSYQNYHYNQKLIRETYNANLDTHSNVIGIEVDYNEYYPPNQKVRNNRPLSPPPQDFSKNYHTMVYIPYNRIEGCQPIVSHNQYHQTNEILKLNHLSSQNVKCDEYLYRQKVHQVDHPALAQKPTNKFLKSNQIRVATYGGCESPLLGQTAVKSTQTLSAPLLPCNYFPNVKCRPAPPIWNDYGNCNIKGNPQVPSMRIRCPLINKNEDVAHEDSNFQYNNEPVSKESKYCVDLSSYFSSKTPSSPTKPKIMERGVPEGAASVSPVVSGNIRQNNSNIVTSPSSYKSTFYAMNV